MTMKRLNVLALATAGCALLVPTQAFAQDAKKAPGQNQGRAVFAAPVRIKAGDKFLGEGRLYPSPVFHDVDGDKLPDIVIGDLFGKVTVACRTTEKDVVRFTAEKDVKDRDGQPLKFHNW